MKRIYFIFLLVFFSRGALNASVRSDSLNDWIKQFYTIGNLEYSANARWIAIKKWYSHNIDTVMVFDTQKNNSEAGYLLKKPFLEFTKDDHLLAFGNNEAIWWNLSGNKKIRFENVAKAFLLTDDNRFCILDKHKNLEVFDTVGRRLFYFSQIITYTTDRKKKLLVCQKNGSIWSVNMVYQNESKTIFTSDNEIRKHSDYR